MSDWDMLLIGTLFFYGLLLAALALFCLFGLLIWLGNKAGGGK
jgi:hypothetical protein